MEVFNAGEFLVGVLVRLGKGIDELLWGERVGVSLTLFLGKELGVNSLDVVLGE